MITLLILAEAVTSLQPLPRALAQARGEIIRPVQASHEQWEQVHPDDKSERIVRAEDGRPLLLRTIEMP